MVDQHRKVRAAFQESFQGTGAVVVRSPARVNLIGEHTDYNDGFVMPAAVNHAIYFAMAPNQDGHYRFVSLDLDDRYSCRLDETPLEQSGEEWPDYFLGVIDQLLQREYSIPGFDCVFGGDIPIGAGMSSSAALEGGMFAGLNAMYELQLDRLTMTKLGQKAENEFVGVQCGIMDQFANHYGRKNSVFQLDCRSLDYEYHPFAREDLRIVLCDTTVRRGLADSEYNERRRQCEEGVKILQQYDRSIQALRDVSPDLLQSHRQEFEQVVYRRCEYVVRENSRVLEAGRAIETEEYRRVGELMYESHAGLRDQYEVSCDELDFLVGLTRDMPGVYGARMMGAGFGGCTINLVQNDAIGQLKKTVQDEYQQEFGETPPVYVSTLTDGTEVLDGIE